jgi:ABC-type multidrug transport system fused ATPase/permease subunit
MRSFLDVDHANVLIPFLDRSNLDPFDEYGDDEVWDSLKWVRMKDMVEALPGQACADG